MDLGNAFQVILFLLPGFLLVRAFLLFIPSRGKAGDAELIAGSIAITAIVWLFAFVLPLILSGSATALGLLFNKPWHPNFAADWLGPALSLHTFTATDVIPGLVLNAAAVGSGVLLAGLVLEESGQIRVFQFRRGPRFVRRLRLDLNPRVWNWFFQSSPADTVYRLTLADGTNLLAQITEYSTDPDDDTLDLVIRGYSAWSGKAWVDIKEATAAIVRRPVADRVACGPSERLQRRASAVARCLAEAHR